MIRVTLLIFTNGSRKGKKRKKAQYPVESNPRSLDYEALAIPLCCDRGPSSHILDLYELYFKSDLFAKKLKLCKK